jgi:hypothetical protein
MELNLSIKKKKPGPAGKRLRTGFCLIASGQAHKTGRVHRFGGPQAEYPIGQCRRACRSDSRHFGRKDSGRQNRLHGLEAAILERCSGLFAAVGDQAGARNAARSTILGASPRHQGERVVHMPITTYPRGPLRLPRRWVIPPPPLLAMQSN